MWESITAVAMTCCWVNSGTWCTNSTAEASISDFGLPHTSCSLLFTWPRKLGISLDCLTLSQHQANLKPAKRSSMVRLALPLAVQSSASFQHVALKKSPFGTRMPCCFCQLVQVPYGTTRFCWLKDQINREDDTLRIGMGTGWWTFPKVLASETKWDQNIDGDVLKERALVFERFCGVFYAVPGFLSFYHILSIYVNMMLTRSILEGDCWLTQAC